MVKINYIITFLLLSCSLGYSEQNKVKIVSCDDYYCTQLATGEQHKIVKQVDWGLNKLTLSPDEKYVAYTTSNWLGFENEGRDVFYCKVDGSERMFLHKFQICVHTLLWESSDSRSYIFVVPKNCGIGGQIQVIDWQSKNVVFTCAGDSLGEIPGTDCYEVYYNGNPPWAARQRICLHDLEAIKKPDSLNMRFFIGWGNWDIYISTQRDQILRFNELAKSTREQEQSLRNVMFREQFAHSKIISDAKDNVIVFFSNDKTSGFFGVVDTENKKLLLFDKSNSLRFSAPTWSPDGKRLAVLRTSDWDRYFDFYEIDDKGEMNLIKTYRVETDRALSDFRWSDDSKKFYYSYLFSNYQKVQVEVELEDK
ncbi:MAG: hypothetical protein MUP17_03765 [candidate division Zixibacteria bacterium]|nr:hypothetical protein [candidate division Zixibacteria bacterium]